MEQFELGFRWLNGPMSWNEAIRVRDRLEILFKEVEVGIEGYVKPYDSTESDSTVPPEHLDGDGNPTPPVRW